MERCNLPKLESIFHLDLLTFGRLEVGFFALFFFFLFLFLQSSVHAFAVSTLA